MSGSRKRIGRYKVLRRIGAGGMGEVYEVLDEQLGRRAAAKLLLPEYSRDSELVARLFNEARAVNIIGHPGIVNIYEFGECEDGAAYYIMELLEGESLKARLAAGALPQLAARIGQRVATAMAAAHERGVVHRDLKPDNLFLFFDPEAVEGVRIKVLDFGIAKLAPQHRSPGSLTETRPQALLGTPMYMAPEQCRGAAEVGPAADVYALGAVLYHVAAGEPPFVAEGAGAVMAMHIYEEPRPLAARDPRLAGPLGDLILEMLRKDADARPTMSAVAARLARLGARPVEPPAADSAAPALITTHTRGERAQSELPAPPAGRLGPAAVAVLLLCIGLGTSVRHFVGASVRSGAGARALADAAAAGPLDLAAPPDLARPDAAPAAVERSDGAAAATGTVTEGGTPPPDSVQTTPARSKKKRTKEDLVNETLRFVR